MPKPALGRGLGALLGSKPGKSQPSAVRTTAQSPTESADAESVQMVALDRIRPLPHQPRKSFAPEALEELAQSIREQGVIQPLIVRERSGKFELIAGERRWRASQIAGLKSVPVIVREADDRVALELALIENLQRENLNPIEEAQGFEQLITQFELTQDEAATRVGKSRAGVANALRLLKLDPQLQAYVRDGRLSVGHAKVILGLEAGSQQRLAAERVIKKSLNVRQTEKLVGDLQKGRAPSSRDRKAILSHDAHLETLQTRLRERLGTRVELRYGKGGKGQLNIRFFNDEDLERILGIIGIDLE